MALLQQNLIEELEQLRARSQLSNLGPCVDRLNCEVFCAGRRLIDFTSWNIFGFGERIPVNSEILQAIEKEGLSSGTARGGTGTVEAHSLCERRLANFLGDQRAILFNTRNQAVLSAVTTLFQEGDFIVFQEDMEAPIGDAAVFTGAKTGSFRFGALEEIKRQLDNARGARRKAIFIESVRSLTGELSDLEEISAIASQNNAALFIDDTFALGVIGSRGAASSDLLPFPPALVCRFGSLSHALSTIGAFVSGASVVCDLIEHRSRHLKNEVTFASFAPLAAVFAIDQVESFVNARVRLLAASKRIARELKVLGLDTPHEGVSPILSVVVDSQKRATQYQLALIEHGCLVMCLPMQRLLSSAAVIRIIISSIHTDAQIDQLLLAFSDIQNRVL